MNSSPSVCLVTGANGFVGSRLLGRLACERRPVLGVARGARVPEHCVHGPDLGGSADWTNLLADCEVVVHLAARVHVMTDKTSNPLEAFRVANVEGSVRLARQAAAAGVRRFVYMSSVKVNGEQTAPGCRFAESDSPAPSDAYGVSKAEAEVGLMAVAADTGMELTIIRPPLVYGPGVRANFLSMMRWLARGIPLPLGAVEDNRRSLVALDNLVDLVVTCTDHPAAANQVFLAGDGEDLSTTDLLRRLAAEMAVPARLLPVPDWALHAGARLTGQEKVFQRLCGNLQVDISKAREMLGWTPPIGVDEGLRRAAEGFRR